MDATSMASKTAFVAQGWDFTGIWCYTTLDAQAKPALRTFFDSVDGSGVASKVKASAISFSPAPVTIDGAGTYTIDVYAGGYTIDSVAIDASGLASGVTAVVNGNQIVVTVSESAAEAIDCTLGVTVTIGGVAQDTKALSIKTATEGGSTPDSPTYSGGSSSGCNAGIGAMFAVLGLALVLKKK